MNSTPQAAQTLPHSPEPDWSPPPQNLVPAIRASLNAKLERLLHRPLVACIADADLPAEITEPDEADEDDSPPETRLDDLFQLLMEATDGYEPMESHSRRRLQWLVDPDDGSCTVRIHIDYEDLWRGGEREVEETVSGCIEGEVTFLTGEQRKLLERSPREFLELEPAPQTAELVSYETEMIGGSKRVVAVTVAEPPESRGFLRHVAVVPNLIPLQRQLAGLHAIVCAEPDGPIGPLRCLVGLDEAPVPPTDVESPTHSAPSALPGERLDRFQVECIHKAMTTPHFAVIQGPPGSGKTTVITGIIQRVLARGGRVLVVSPTHVAVDNVVEKLIPEAGPNDDLDPSTIPVRFAAKKGKLSPLALAYWVSNRKQRRAASIARRLQACLSKSVPQARELFALEDESLGGLAPLTGSVAAVHEVICGTPIGILSLDSVKDAPPGSFDLLIVDEVSKLTLPEFLAIAVKARRWVLVGDPNQLPPYNNAEENAATLDDVLSPTLELACSVGAVVERLRPGVQRDARLVVVTRQPGLAVAAIRAHLEAVMSRGTPVVAQFEDAGPRGIVVCSPEQLEQACELLAPLRGHDRTHNGTADGSVRILVERGLGLERPEVASGKRFVEPRERAPAVLFGTSFNVFHAQPWSRRADQKLSVVAFRNGLQKSLPSSAALEILHPEDCAFVRRVHTVDAIAERFAVNAVSVYDWLTGIETDSFDVSPLLDLDGLASQTLVEAVRPFVGTLQKQYRMHSSLSAVPRELFYFGQALQDGLQDDTPGCRVQLMQVAPDAVRGEWNPEESEAIFTALGTLDGSCRTRGVRMGVMVITPYRSQEALLNRELETLQRQGALAHLDIDVCTLDRCQGREAEYVFISLVRSRATVFLDIPKRWNVALTRAKRGLVLVGNIDAYLVEAGRARRDPRAKGGRVKMSLLARILEAYDRQISNARNRS